MQVMPRLSAVVAMGENRVIGKDNQLPWHLPADLSHFKMITMGHPILMGRKTYESIGRPLPGRTNIILTRDTSLKASGCLIAHTYQDVMDYAAREGANEVFIIGGAEIYQQWLPNIQRIYLTIVHHDFEGTAYFPALDATEWREVSREKHEADEKNVYSYSFLQLERDK